MNNFGNTLGLPAFNRTPTLSAVSRPILTYLLLGDFTALAFAAKPVPPASRTLILDHGNGIFACLRRQ